jgi:hypothetical protein
MIFGLQSIAGALDLSQDAALLLFFLEKAAKGHRKRSQVSGVRKISRQSGLCAKSEPET